MTPTVVTLDFESYWSSKAKYSLSKMGPIEYIKDPRFLAQMLSVRIDHGETQVYEYDEIAPALATLHLDDPDVVTVGHNINGFDALVLSMRYGIHPANIHDPMVMMRWTGLSMHMSESLKTLSLYLDHGTKVAGTATSDGKRLREDFTDDEWAFFRQYCADDTTQCSENYFSLLPYMTDDALRFCSMTAKMATEPCLIADREKLQAFIDRLDRKTAESMEGLSHLFQFGSTEDFLKALRSNDSFISMMRKLGVEAPMKVSIPKTKRAMEECWDRGEATSWKKSRVFVPALSKTDQEFVALLDSDDENVAALVSARLEQFGSGPLSRAENILKVGSDGTPIPVQLAAFKAHTSRYAAGNSEGKSDGLNFQNFPKRNKDMKELRKCLVSPEGQVFLSCDSSQIEARMLAYVAREKHLLEDFRNGRDPYSDLAASIFKVDADTIRKNKDKDPRMKMYRNVGKTAILSAGYGVGPGQFSKMLWLQGARLGDDLKNHQRQAEFSLAIYRKYHPHIVKMWADMETALRLLSHGKTFEYGGPTGQLFTFGPMPMPGTDELVPSVLMPSGFMLRYPGLRYEKDPYFNKYGYVYDQWQGDALITKKIYGGLLTENLVQCLAFQLLMWQAVEMDKAGIKLKCNIHDAFLTCVPEAEAEHTAQLMTECMSRVPAWLEGFPVACECSEVRKDFAEA
jgi:DNA polymerase